MTDLHVDIDPDALAPGTRLGEFEIERVLGVGGFGIVYLAFDHALERRVALKEYMPSTLAARRSGLQVAVRSRAHAETFGAGLRSFVNEARLLARFDHPALVKVHRFWESNGTAYMAMSYCEGQTLGSARAAMGSPPNEAWLLTLTDAVLGALETLHREQVYHRDVAPDNIMLLPSGAPVLLDFGAARHVIGDSQRALTAIVKPNFASIEQYAEAGALRQGPWSDIYSLGAVLHFCLIGRAPMPATLRVVRDELPSLRELRQELVAADGTRYSDAFLGAIDTALAVLPDGRPQSAAAFSALLRGQALLPRAALAGALSSAFVAPALSADAHALERASFAPTTELQHERTEAVAVTTSWRTLGDGPSNGRTVRRAVASRAKLAAVALATLSVVGVIWYGSAMRAPPPLAVVPAAAEEEILTRQPLTLAPVPVPAPTSPEPQVAPPQQAATRKAAAAVTPTPARRAAALTARASCGDRNFFSMQFCLDRQCRKADFARDPECVERLRQQSSQAQPGS